MCTSVFGVRTCSRSVSVTVWWNVWRASRRSGRWRGLSDSGWVWLRMIPRWSSARSAGRTSTPWTWSFPRSQARAPSRLGRRFLRPRPAGVEMVPVEDGVEDERVAAVGLPPPHRVVGEEDHAAPAHRAIDDRGLLGQLLALVEHPRHPEVVLLGELRDHPRQPVLGRELVAHEVQDLLGDVGDRLRRALWRLGRRGGGAAPRAVRGPWGAPAG